MGAKSEEAAWTSRFYDAEDGLKLHYRDYPGRDDRPPIVCLPGLTRNARDFEPVADMFSGEWRVISMDYRGRGDSDYAKDTATYHPGQYVSDVTELLRHLEVESAVFCGTSLGGIVTMLLARQAPWKVAAAILNDIGPEIEARGLEDIRGYVGQGGSYPTWMHAARSIAESTGPTYPDYEITDWLRLAKRMMCVGGNGRIAYDYDMKIAEAFKEDAGDGSFDLWLAFKALAGKPVLALRGSLSEILSEPTFARMQEDMPEMMAVTVPNVGHIPTLEEPVAQAAIAQLLAKVA